MDDVVAPAEDDDEIKLATANRRASSESAGCSEDSVEPELEPKPTKVSSQDPFSVAEDWSAIAVIISLCQLHANLTALLI